MPSAMRRSANSETMIASSTSIPTARISEKQHHDVDRQAGELQAEHARQKRGGNCDADEQRCPESQCEQDNDRNQLHAGEDRVLQIGQHLADDLRLVLGECHRTPSGHAPCSTSIAFFTPSTVSMRLAAGALGHLNRHRGHAVDARDRRRILEGRPNGHDVADGDGSSVGGRHRNLQNVLRTLDQARHLHGEAAGRALQGARRDQAVGCVEADDKLVERRL